MGQATKNLWDIFQFNSRTKQLSIIFLCGMYAVGIENGKRTLAHIINDGGKDDDNSKGALCVFYISKECWFCKDLILFRIFGNGLIVFYLAANVLTSPRHTPTHPSCKSILIRCCTPPSSPNSEPTGWRTISTQNSTRMIHLAPSPKTWGSIFEEAQHICISSFVDASWIYVVARTQSFRNH